MIPPRMRHQADAAAGPALTVLLSVVAAAQALRLWGWRPGIPLSSSGDSPHVLSQIRSIMSGQWYGLNPRVGAPFGMNQAWFTTADVINFGGIRLIGLFTDSPATAGAIFFVLGFPAAALTAYWLARRLRLSRPAAVTVGVLFAVLPGHQLWFSHLWLAAYWMVPLALWLVIETAQGGRLWASVAEMRRTAPQAHAARLRVARTVGVVLAVGLADVYYVAFTLLLLAVVLVFRLGTGTRAPKLVPGAAVTAAIGMLCAVSLFVATRSRGGDVVTGALPAQRGVGESEIYAGKLIELLLPWYEHRVGGLRFLSMAYGVAAPASVERPALGIIALSGVVMIAWVSLTSLAVGRRINPLWGLLGAITLVSLGFYTRGGLGSVVALFFTPQIRTWSRFVVVIGLLGLLAFGLWITRLGRRRGRRVAWVAAVLALGVGVLDQTSPGAAPDYQALRAQEREMASYGRAIADHFAEGCAVFQLPVVSYPEDPPRGHMGDYDHLLPANAAPDDVRWSYGAIRGTASGDWQLALPVANQERLLQDVTAAGFCAVEIDADGYADATNPTREARALLGPPVAEATNEHRAAYDLAPLRTTLEASLGEDGLRRRQQDVLRPVVASLSGSLVDTEGADPFQWTGRNPTVAVSNMGSVPVEVRVSMKVQGVGSSWRTVGATLPDGPALSIDVSDRHSEDLVLTGTVPPGRTSITLSATGQSEIAPGTDGRITADLQVSLLQVTTSSTQNAASLQQFAASSPPILR